MTKHVNIIGSNFPEGIDEVYIIYIIYVLQNRISPCTIVHIITYYKT